MPLINLILLSAKSTLLCSLCDAELDPINISLLPADKMLSFVSRRHQRYIRRGRGISSRSCCALPCLFLKAAPALETHSGTHLPESFSITQWVAFRGVLLASQPASQWASQVSSHGVGWPPLACTSPVNFSAIQ